MSRPGNPRDNAKAESFMKTLRAEEANSQTYVDLEDARSRIGAFIDEVYNENRLYSALGNKSPVAFEASREKLPTNSVKTCSPCHQISVSQAWGAVHDIPHLVSGFGFGFWGT